jgi:hypothetical protein
LTDGAPQLHPDLVPYAFLLGTWAGVGVVGYPTIEEYQFGQEVFFTHVGKPYLAYESRAWRLDADGNRVAPAARESGYWRPQPDGKLEVTLAHPTGVVEIWLGEISGTKIEMSTDVVARTTTAKEVTAGHRLYGLVDGDLLWAYDMAAMGHSLQPHLSARLRPVR